MQVLLTSLLRTLLLPVTCLPPLRQLLPILSLIRPWCLHLSRRHRGQEVHSESLVVSVSAGMSRRRRGFRDTAAAAVGAARAAAPAQQAGPVHRRVVVRSGVVAAAVLVGGRGGLPVEAAAQATTLTKATAQTSWQLLAIGCTRCTARMQSFSSSIVFLATSAAAAAAGRGPHRLSALRTTRWEEIQRRSCCQLKLRARALC